MDSLLCFWSDLLSIKYPSVASVVRISYGNRQNRDIVIIFFFFFKRPTAPLASLETIIHSLNRFALTCAGPFHKINTGYEATTTVNSTCLMYGYYFDAILLN